MRKGAFFIFAASFAVLLPVAGQAENLSLDTFDITVEETSPVALTTYEETSYDGMVSYAPDASMMVDEGTVVYMDQTTETMSVEAFPVAYESEIIINEVAPASWTEHDATGSTVMTEEIDGIIYETVTMDSVVPATTY